MSLINKMLQDLEQRKSGTEVLGNWQGQVRAAPASRSGGVNWAVALGLVCALAAGTGGAAWWLNKEDPKPAIAEAQPSAQQLPSSPSSPPSPPLSLKLDHSASGLPDVSASQITDPALSDNAADAGLRDASTSALPSATEENAPSGKDKADPVPRASVNAASQATPTPEHSGSKRSNKSMPAPALASSLRSVPDSARNQRQPLSPSAGTASTEGDKALASAPAKDIDEESLMPVKVSKQIKELTPAQRAENDYRRALTLIEQGRSKEAAGNLEQALQLDSRHAAARQTLAALMIDGKRPDEAMRVLSEGLNLDRSQPGLAMMLARLQVDRQDARAAIQTLQASLPHANERADYRAFMAALLQREARHKEAIDHYTTALTKTPNNGVWWMGLGISLQAENRLAEARDAFGRAKSSGMLSAELLAFVEQKLAQLR